MNDDPVISVQLFEPSDTEEWRAFLSTSNNGTLFHDLDFLSYHPADRFVTHHLIFRRKGKLVALLPAAICEDGEGGRCLKSPYAASIGGLVMPQGMGSETAIASIVALQQHVVKSGLSGAEMRIGPAVYLRRPNDLLGFALMASGFRLTQRWLLPIASLCAVKSGDPSADYTKRNARNVRTGLSNGLEPRAAGPAELPVFHDLLVETQTRLGSRPTHSLQELQTLFEKVPGRLKLFLCHHAERAVAGVLVFVLNEVAAFTFYICQSHEHRNLRGTAVLIDHIVHELSEEGIRFLDFGPTTFDDMSLNRGLASFKEGFGAQSYCRDTWRWRAG